jgi:hypothetical protein
MKAARTHIEGLRKMVTVRGGFEGLRASNHIVASVAMWFVALSHRPQSKIPF